MRVFPGGRTLAALVLLVSAGCGEGTVKVRPKFLYDDQPLAGAAISFIRVNGEQGRAAFGTTDEDGVAQLTTFEPYDGVLEGNYNVVVIKAPENPYTYDEVELNDNVDQDKLLQMSAMQQAGQAAVQQRKRKRTILPERYADMSQTPLKCEVTRGVRDVVFKLTSE
ncbi:MAG: hypothetical protein AAGF97_03365 [Planctomycetota bacterium]